MKDKLVNLIPDAATVLLVTLMVAAAEITGEREIIFPEITALAIGYIVAEKRSWHVNSLRIIILITACAVAGVLIVRSLSIGVLPEMLLAFAVCQVVFMYSGTTFAPFVSAVILPIMLQTEIFVYPIAAFVLTLLIIAVHHILLKCGLRKDEDYVPKRLDSASDKLDALLRVISVCGVGYIAFSLGCRFMIAPPLLVAYTEFSRPGNKARNKPFKTIAVFTLCSAIGTACRYLINITAGLPLTAAAAAAAVLMLAVIHKSRMFMPPAGAITILAMIVPESAVMTFPVQICAGVSVFMLLTHIIFKSRHDRIKDADVHELSAE